MNNLSQTQMLEKYNCEKCRFSTKDLNKYKIHIGLHNDMKYVCSYCDFQLYSKTEFQRHLVSHTGKFPFTCEYCGYGAIRNDYIVKHIKRIHGDGKIQCSVSTVENESKNASVNIVQTQMGNSLQEILPNNTPLVAKSLIDLTSEMDNSSCYLNGNSTGTDQVEVEVLSPTDQQLCPWMPLTVIAPTSFRVPEICFAQVLEVKPANSTCYLVLKCLDVTDLNGIKYGFLKQKNPSEQNTSEPIVTSENGIEPSDGSSLILSGTESLLPLKNTAVQIEEKSNGLTSPPNGNETLSTLSEVSSDSFDETEDLSDGPVISSVFSLSSENVIEGIQWENPFVDNTNASMDIVDTTPSLNGMESQGGPKVLESEAKSQIQIEMACESKVVLQNNLPETNTMEAKNASPEMQLLLNKPVLPYGKQPENQTSAVTQSDKGGGRKLNRLCKIETDLFNKPRTLFLSCDKRIVMQPLSCVMQTGQKAAVSKENELVQFKVKRKIAKTKGKLITKRFAAPILKTLRLSPVQADQLTKMPHNNQPVVVLNHPEMESLEVSSIMKAISMFKGMVLKVTLSKKTRRKIV